MKVALDSNMMIYAEGLTDDRRGNLARDVLSRIPANQLIIPAQSLAETFFWLVSRAKLPQQAAAKSAHDWLSRYVQQATDGNVMRAAMDIVSRHKLQVFDSIILAAAAEANCDVLLSEDMQHGFRWRGVTVVNPFLPEPHPLLEQLLKA